MALTGQYSGIFINQNATPTNLYDWRSNGGGWTYQTFDFPTNYERGTDSDETRIPDLSGFQVLVSIDDGYEFTATLDYQIQYYAGDTDVWPTVASGTIIGNHASGNKVWFDVLLPESIPISSSQLDTPWRIGIATRQTTGGAFKQPVVTNDDGSYTIGDETFVADLVEGVPFAITVDGAPAFLYLDDLEVTYSLQQGVSWLWYVSPTPLVNNRQAYQADQTTPFLGLGTTSSLNFRVLGLTADDGVDFLGNEYRSCVVQASVGNTITTSGTTPVEGSGQGGYYMSPPQPSRFAVLNQYFDVRPVPDTPLVGDVNLVGNPSFEYDHAGQAPYWWSSFNNGGTVIDQTVKSNLLANSDPNYTSWVADRFQALHMQYGFTVSNQSHGIISPFYTVASSSGGSPTPVSVELSYDLLIANNTSLALVLSFYNSSQTLLPSPYGTQSFFASTVGTGTLSGTTVVPANAAYMKISVIGLMTSGLTGTFSCLVDAIQMTNTSVVEPYFDGDDVNAQWFGQKGQSASVQLVDQEPENNYSVIDGVLLDPITPNVAFNVYYTQDDAHTSAFMTDDDWDQKLWIHIPKVFIATQRQQYLFPQPIHAKYVKIEYTNLQPQTFDPGAFQKPIAYKKFPTWVASFFVGLLESPAFTASQVSVQYDALSFAYQYFLDDLGQAPDAPVAPPTTAIAQLTNYFTSAPTGVDPTTLAQINFTMQTFTSKPGVSLSPSTSLLNAMVRSVTADPTTAPPATYEGGTLTPVDYSTVSSLQREPVVIEQSTPVMYFFLTCRHGYKEVMASFSHNRAFFVGVNEVALIRNDYTVAADTPLYIETGGDPVNVELSDFVLEDDIWYTY